MKTNAAAIDRIVSAAQALAAQEGFTVLTVSKVAERAGVSTALVHYHFDTKLKLLAAAAERLSRERAERRIAALVSRRGLAAMDALWDAVLEDATSGTERAWLELQALAKDEGAARSTVAASRITERSAFAARLPRLMQELGSEAALGGEESAAALVAVLDGLGSSLTIGEPADAVRAAYDAFWLAMIASGQSGRRR